MPAEPRQDEPPLAILEGGPFDKAEVTVDSSGLNCEGVGVPEGYAAHYRRTRRKENERTVYRFDGLTEIIARIPIGNAPPISDEKSHPEES